MTAPTPTSSLGDRVVTFIVEKPWWVLLLLVLYVGAFSSGMKSLGADFTYRIWFNEDDPFLQEFDAFERRFGSDEVAVIMVHSPSGVFDLDTAGLVQELTDRMWKVPEVIRVDSLSNFNWVHAVDDDVLIEPLIPDDIPLTEEILKERETIALAHETLPRYLVGPDGKTAIIFASLQPSITALPDYKKIMESIRAVLADFRSRTDHIFHVSGGPAVSYSFQDSAQTDMKNLVPIVLGLTVLCLLLIFRRIAGIILPMLVVFVSVIVTLGTTAHIGIKLNNLTTAVPQIMVALSIAHSVHILASFFRARAYGVERREAAHYSLRKNLQPTLLTAVSTTLGFLSFSTADVAPIGHLGLIAGIGSLHAWAVSHLLLGPAIALLPLKAGKRPLAGDIDSPTDRTVAIADWLAAKRTPIIALSVLLTVGMGLKALDNEVNSDPFSYFAKDAPLNLAADFSEEHIGGAMMVELVADAGEEEGIKDPKWLAKVEHLQQWIAEKPFVTNTVSIIDILKAMNKSLHGEDPKAYVLPDSRELLAQQLLLYTMGLPQGMDINDRVAVGNSAVRMTVTWTLRKSNDMLATIDLIEKKAEAMGLDVHITGKAQLYQRMNPYVVKSFIISISAAVILVSLLLMWVFGSVKLGIMAMVPNGIPLIIGAGALALLGKSLDVGTVIVFSTGLGIAVDDTVHFLSNYNTLRRKGVGSHGAVAAIFHHTAPALMITTTILVVAFGTFAFATFIPNLYFGTLVAFVLVVALAADLVLLPALLMKEEGGAAFDNLAKPSE